jgi:hypothetical protein
VERLLISRSVLAAVALATLVAAFTGPAGAATAEDAFIAGYAAAVLEREFGLTPRSLTVRDGVLTIHAADLAGADRARVQAALARVRGVARVEILERAVPAEPPPPAAVEPERRGVLQEEWAVGPLPGGTLFRPLIADPRWPHFAASNQSYLRGDLDNVAAVSFGESFTLFRGSLGPAAWWEVGIQAGVFSVFDLESDSFDLVNADYFVGIPLGWRWENWSAMLRLYHQSSHLGDEFLLRRTRLNRINLSYEAVDLKVSWDWRDVLRLYAGGGYLFDQEPSSLDPWSVQYGIELTSPWPGRQAGWRPIAAADIQHREENRWSSDVSIRAGIEIDGVLVTRRMQILLEYFLGRSPNGQFYTEKIEYLGLGVHFHF